MFKNHPAVEWLLIALAVLLLLPLVGMIGMMVVGAITGAGMMSQMDDMMGGIGSMSAPMIALCVL